MKKAAIAGFILLLLGGIFFGIYSLLPDHDYGGVTNVEINAAMYADLSEDGTKIAINDSYEKIYCIDKNTGRMEYLVDQLQGPWDYFEDVLFDQEKNLYAYLLEMDEDGAVTIRESIVKYSSSGKELGRIVCYDKERDGERLQQTDECVFGIHIKDGYVYYTIYTNGRLNLMRGKIGGESECLSTCSFHDSRNLRWCVESGEGGYITCWSNSDVGHVSEDGIYTSLYQFHYRIDSQEADNILPGQCLYENGVLYILNKDLANEIYAYDGENMKRLVDLKELYGLGDMTQEEYVDFCIDHMMYVMRYENGLLEIASASTLFFYDLATGEIETVEGHFSLPAKQWIVSVCKTVLPAVGALLAAAGLVLVIGSVMRWRVTIRSKLILTILPVVIIGFSVTTAAILKQVENNYYETIHEEYEAVSELAVKQLDPELIASIDGIEDIENGNLEKLKKQVDEIFFSSDLDWSEEMIVNIFSYDESGVNRILFGTENRDSFFDYIYFTTIDKLEPERVGNTDTYVTTSHTGIEQYIDVVTLIRDENGKIIAMLDLSGYLDRYARTLYEIKKDIVMKSILLVSCLALLIFLITMYINRKLRKTTEVIQEISNGDFSVRVERLSRDELGIIGQGVNNMAMQIEKMFEEKDDFALQVIEALVGTIDAKDKYTNGHSLRVAKYSREIAKRLGKSEEEQLYVYYAGLLHDIGKIGIPDHIINKTSRLDDDEYARIKTHPVIGNEILSKLSSLQYISMGAYGHHERYDGKGYSQGLKGEEIPEIARIIGVADAYDAMTSNRSYRNAMSQEKVRREIEKGKGTQFDARFAEIMLELDTLYEKEIYGHF